MEEDVWTEQNLKILQAMLKWPDRHILVGASVERAEYSSDFLKDRRTDRFHQFYRLVLSGM